MKFDEGTTILREGKRIQEKSKGVEHLDLEMI